MEVGLDKDDKTVANVVDKLRASFWVLKLRLCWSRGWRFVRSYFGEVCSRLRQKVRGRGGVGQRRGQTIGISRYGVTRGRAKDVASALRVSR